MRFALSLLCCMLPLAVEGAETAAKLPGVYQSLADLARGAPPEFAADALLRIAEQGRMLDKAARHDLIEEAFRSAASAKFPVRMQGVQGTTTDTASGSLSRAYALRLDALSLQSRAVRDMLPLDAAFARRLFTEITRPTLTALTCDDALYYDLSDFYQTLGAVVNAAFTPKERAKEEHLNFLSDYLGQATSPLELAPLAQVIASVSATAPQRQGLWARLAGLLESMQMDDRAASAALPALNSLNVPELEPSLEKYRQRSHGCDADGSNAPAGLAKDASKKPNSPKLDSYWQSANSQQLMAPGKKLRFDKNNTPLSEADRSTPAYQQQVADYLNQLAGWSADQEHTESDYYHEKATVLLSLIELVPSGPQSDSILADYLSFISSSNLYQQSPAEWYLEPQTLLERFRPGTPMRSKLLDAFQTSGNPVLGLTATLEKATKK